MIVINVEILKEKYKIKSALIFSLIIFGTGLFWSLLKDIDLGKLPLIYLGTFLLANLSNEKRVVGIFWPLALTVTSLALSFYPIIITVNGR